MNSRALRGHLVAVAVASALGLGAVSPAMANETSGSVSGYVIHRGSETGLKAVIKSKATGQTRTVDISDTGSFRFPQAQVGTYDIQILDAKGDVLKESQVRVTLGGNAVTNFDLAMGDDVERISVVGSTISMVNTTDTNTGLTIGETDFDKLPVGRDTTAIALLAPGTTRGDTAFGNLAAFGGASVAENAYYINGLNVTNFRNGLGGSSVPFEFYKEFKVKTGGYSAEFGRSLGGVIDAVTKSGTNEFEVGANYFYSPDSLREDSPNTRYRNGRIYIPNDKDEGERKEANIWVSGPIIKDKLFFYALYNPRDVSSAGLTAGSTASSSADGGQSYITDDADDAFWGANLDWFITDDHHLQFTIFNDKSDTSEMSYGYDYANGRIESGDAGVLTTKKRGGKNWLLKYTGYLTDDLTMSALYGRNKYDLSDINSAAAECKGVVDLRSSTSDGYMGQYPSCSGSSYTPGVAINKDERKAFRVDFEWTINDQHTVKFGYDSEKLESFNDEFTYSGGELYVLRTLAPGGQLDNDWINNTGNPLDYFYVRNRTLNGTFSTKSNAYYIEDQWQVTDNIFASIGLRNDAFQNNSVNGRKFIDVDNQWAPRLGVTWDIQGDGTSKLFANYGLYYLPIANNTNVRVAGAEMDFRDYYAFGGMGADGVPIAGAQLGDRLISSNGGHPEDQLADKNIKPMYQEEWILGFEQEFAPGWLGSARYTHRDLKRVIDDYCNAEPGYAQFPQDCALINPGFGATIGLPDSSTGTGPTVETVHYTAEDFGLPKAKRKYDAVTLELKHRQDNLMMAASYTWSHLRGNSEGYVKSDNGQDDAGITQDWDFPLLMDGAYGDLPNDRRHSFKFYGAYNITDAWTAGWNFSVQSGRPINAFGASTPTGDSPAWGDTYYVTDPETGDVIRIPRGSMGTTPWITNLDLSTAYTMHFNEVDVKLSLDIFNVLDASGTTEVYEFAESDPGSPNAAYGLTSGYQSPRSVRLGVEVKY